MKDQLDDHELVSMSQQYSQAHDGTYVTHTAYAEINRQVMAGRQWAKCPNCGNPYPLDREGATWEVCSVECYDDYVAYLNESIHK